MTPTAKRVAVITPYLNEPLEVLVRCHDSILAQTHACTHFLVADGAPCAAIDGWGVEHLVLPASHHDGGDTPRAIGAMSAFNQGYDAVAMLDADNWYAPSHIQDQIAASEASGACVVFSDRTLILETGEPCDFEDADVVAREHVDTSCFFITRQAAFLVAMWGLLDPALWPACDRMMLSFVRHFGVAHVWTGKPSVYYSTHWSTHYRAMGHLPPSKPHWIDWPAVEGAYSFEALRHRYGAALPPGRFKAPPWPSLVGRNGPVAKR